MTVLGLDSAGKRAGVAIIKDGEVLYDVYLAAGNTHSETLLALVQDALRATQLTVAQLSCIGVNAGPGSFTGLRIGLAVAKGLALAQDIPCAGVSTLEALAATCTQNGTVLCALDARRSEVYAAAFAVNGGRYTRLLPDSAVPADSLRTFAQSCPKPLYIMGDGAAVCLAVCGGIADTHLYPAPYTCGRAWGTAAVAAQMLNAGTAGSAEALAPAYHRLSQAQRERAERENHS